jgi:hypothetical protein
MLYHRYVVTADTSWYVGLPDNCKRHVRLRVNQQFDLGGVATDCGVANVRSGRGPTFLWRVHSNNYIRASVRQLLAPGGPRDSIFRKPGYRRS